MGCKYRKTGWRGARDRCKRVSPQDQGLTTLPPTGMHVIVLPSSGVGEADYEVIPARSSGRNGPDAVPAARVGHTAAQIGSTIFVFGGRGGPDMKALDEAGGVWAFDTRGKTWSFIKPAEGSPVPEVRSYHASCASEYPPPSPPESEKPEKTELPQQPPDPSHTLPVIPDEGSYGTLFIHAGCLSSGGRTSDLWAFDLGSRIWTRFPSAPEPARGGTSLCMLGTRLYRYGGFNGEMELGGQIDYLDVLIGSSNDKSGAGAGRMQLVPAGEWESHRFTVGGKEGPGDRSVAGLVPITTGQGRNYLLLLAGERDPSSAGHAAAGKFWDDAWTLQVRAEGMTAGSFKDATRLGLKAGWEGVKQSLQHVRGQQHIEDQQNPLVQQQNTAYEGASAAAAAAPAAGTKDAGEELVLEKMREQTVKEVTGEGKWAEVRYFDGTNRDEPLMIQESQRKPMGPRGWFACALGTEIDGASVVVWGGIDERNERLGDGWIITAQ